MKKKIFIVTGETSGDLHGASLLKELYKIIPPEKLNVKAIGSNHLKEVGADIFFDCKDLASIGLTEIIEKLSLYVNLEKEILKEIGTFTPDIVILVDFPGFNLRLTKKIKKYSPNSKVVYYMPPQVWAWNQSRTKTLAKHCDLVLCGLPFEEKFHKDRGVNASYIGNPIVHELEKFDRKKIREELGFKNGGKLIGVFPGSRKSEIHYMLPVYLKTLELVNEEFPDCSFVVSQAPYVGELEKSKYWRLPEKLKDKVKVLPSGNNNNYKLQCASDLLLLSSGTVTLESALYETPLILGYRSNWLNYFLYKLLVRVDHVGLPNIIAEERIVPELLQSKAKPKEYIKILRNWLGESTSLNEVKDSLKIVREKITEKDASKEAALKIKSLIPDYVVKK